MTDLASNSIAGIAAARRRRNAEGILLALLAISTLSAISVWFVLEDAARVFVAILAGSAVSLGSFLLARSGHVAAGCSCSWARSRCSTPRSSPRWAA